MLYRALAFALLSLVVSGCYRVTIETGAAHAPTSVDRPWQMSFAAGLVPPPEINTQAECPAGVARIQTQRSFLNQLAAGVTSSIISPMDVRIVCAAGPVPR
jgi:hypothetical protein